MQTALRDLQRSILCMVDMAPFEKWSKAHGLGVLCDKSLQPLLGTLRRRFKKFDQHLSNKAWRFYSQSIFGMIHIYVQASWKLPRERSNFLILILLWVCVNGHSGLES